MLIMAGVDNFCASTAPVWQFIGYVLMIFKIVIPLLLLILGMFDLGKAVVANDDKAINKATTTLTKRAIAAVIIFFIPTLIGFVFDLVAGFGDVKDNYKACKTCAVSPTGKICKCMAEDVDNTKTYEDCKNEK